MTIKDELDLLSAELQAAPIEPRGNPSSRLNLREAMPAPKKSKLSMHLSRNLSAQDIISYKEADLGSTAPALKSLRSAHHRIAWLMAMGKPDTEIGAMTGYSGSRLSILKRDPAFSELLSHYEKTNAQIDRNMVDRLATLSIDAMDVLQELLHDNPNGFSVNQLLEIIKAGADRSDAPPVSKSHSIQENRTLTATVIKEIKEIVSTNQQGKVSESHNLQIEGSAVVLKSPANADSKKKESGS